MREEEVFVSLGAVCISLFQCQPPASSSLSLKNYSFCETADDYRGDVLVPFYKGVTTYKELSEGVEYRLNQYCVLHSTEGTQSLQQQQRREKKKECVAGVPTHNESPQGVSDISNSNYNGSFNGSYLCSCCQVSGDAVCFAKMQEPHGVYHEYPRIVVCAFTRTRQRELVNDKVVYDVVDGNMEVTESNIGCFFYCVMEKCGVNTSPIVAEDGSVKRPLIGQDHVRVHSLDRAYSESSGHRGYIEVRVGARVLRIGTCAEQRFEDVFQRLRMRNLHVCRLFDGSTGASILPCELVWHLSWRVSSLCADVVTQPSAVFGRKRRRADAKIDDVTRTECEECYDGEMRTLMTFSDMSPDMCMGSTVSLSCETVYKNRASISAGNSEERQLWNYEQLLNKTTFGFETDDDTVPLAEIFPSQRSGLCALSLQVMEDECTPLRPFCFGDDSHVLSTPFAIPTNLDQSLEASATPAHEDSQLMIESSGSPRVERQLQPSGEGCDCMDISPLMVTQQSMPDLLFDDFGDEDDDS